jgi:hypothetical protein
MASAPSHQGELINPRAEPLARLHRSPCSGPFDETFYSGQEGPMEQLLSYCGYRCDLCPAHKENIVGPEDRQRISDDWRRYFAYEARPEDVDCDGCLAAKEAPNPNCAVRPCALGRGLSHCAMCRDFICDTLRKQLDAIKPIAQKHAHSMSADDRARYIHPYESEERLRKLVDSRPD